MFFVLVAGLGVVVLVDDVFVGVVVVVLVIGMGAVGILVIGVVVFLFCLLSLSSLLFWLSATFSSLMSMVPSFFCSFFCATEKNVDFVSKDDSDFSSNFSPDRS